MKNRLIIVLISILLPCISVFCQNQAVNIISLNVNKVLPPDMAEWHATPGSMMLTAQMPQGVRVNGMQLVLEIKSGDKIVCSNKNIICLPVESFTTRTFNVNDLTGLLPDCKVLKEDTYTVCARFYDLNRKPVSNESCTVFTVKNTQPADYEPPNLISPENGKGISKKDLLKPIIFRWTSVTPQPKDAVKYRLRVWQLQQGQNAAQVIKSNQPDYTKDLININQAVVNNLLSAAGKLSYLPEYYWTVQALNLSDQPVGRNNGTSEPFHFKILDDNINIKIDSVHIGCCVNGLQNVFVQVNNLHPTNQVTINAIKYRVNGTGPLTILSSTSPPTPFTMSPNSVQAFTGSINCVDSMQSIKFIVESFWPTDPDNINNETAWDTLHCACKACDSVNITVDPKVKFIDQGGNIVYNTTISATPKPVKNIKAELVYFEYTPDSDDCMVCNKDPKTYGNFINGTHSQQWYYTPPKNIGTGVPLDMIITVPPTVSCCNAQIKWCIRYVVTFADCTVCDILLCDEIKKEGCTNQPLKNQK